MPIHLSENKLMQGSVICNGTLMYQGMFKYELIANLFELIIEQMHCQRIDMEKLSQKMGLSLEALEELFEYNETTTLEELMELAESLNFNIHITLTPKKLICN